MTETILQKAEDLKNLALVHAELRQQENIIDGFRTRRDTIKSISNSVGTLINLHQIMKRNGIPIENNDPAFKWLLNEITSIYEKFQKDPGSILKPKVADLAQFESKIRNIENSLSLSWKHHTSPGQQGEALVNVLDQYPPFRETVKRIRQLRQWLFQKAQNPPLSEQEVTEVKELKNKLAKEIQSLSGKGLDEEVLDFLRRSATGVPLSELFSKPKILEWLKKENLIKSFQVKCL